MPSFTYCFYVTGTGPDKSSEGEESSAWDLVVEHSVHSSEAWWTARLGQQETVAEVVHIMSDLLPDSKVWVTPTHPPTVTHFPQQVPTSSRIPASLHSTTN